MNWGRHSPPDIGGVDATSIKCREASFDGADGVVKDRTLFKKRTPKHFVNPDHPVCAAAVASHLFIDGAATPPISGGELPASNPFTTSLGARFSRLYLSASNSISFSCSTKTELIFFKLSTERSMRSRIWSVGCRELRN